MENAIEEEKKSKRGSKIELDEVVGADCRIASTIRDGEINSGRNEKD